MFGYATVASGPPSSAQGLADHLRNQTLADDDLAPLIELTGIKACGAAELRPDLHPEVAEGLAVDPLRTLDRHQVAALFAGRRADGRPILGKRGHQHGIGSLDVSLTADKSVSVAWAFGTPVERAALYQTHRSATESALHLLTERIGVARRGQGGRLGAEPGHLGWLSFDHFTARPTWNDGLVPGDPDVHTHHTILNAVFAPGHIGSLFLRDLEAMKKEIGALYHAFLATGLRRLGVRAELDMETGAATLPSVPRQVRQGFSKKTVDGEAMARKIAGEEWTSLSRGEKASLMKFAVQGRVGQGMDLATATLLRRDDVAQFEEWRNHAYKLGYHQSPLLHPDLPLELPQKEERIRIAVATAEAWIEQHAREYAAPSEWDYRVAAARGLISSGLESTDELDVVRSLLPYPKPLESDGFKKPASGITKDEAHTQSVAMRGQKREQGLIGPDAARVLTIEGRTLDLAVGDRLMLHGRARGMTGRGGSFGGAGTIATVAAVDVTTGLTLTRDNGRSALIPWKNLADDQGRLKLAYGDVVPTVNVELRPDPAAEFLRQAAALNRSSAAQLQRGMLALERSPETGLSTVWQQQREEAEVAAILPQIEQLTKIKLPDSIRRNKPRARLPMPIISPDEAKREFAEALYAGGFELSGDPIMDGQWHRERVAGDRSNIRSKDGGGRYRGFLDGRPAGYIQNFKSPKPEGYSWKSQSAVPEMTAQERRDLADRKAAREAETRAKIEAATEKARALWDSAYTARRDPYLTKKGVQAHGLRVTKWGGLLVPGYRDGEIQVVQVIKDGNKRFLKDSDYLGSYGIIGTVVPDMPVAISEGYATAATFHEVTGIPTAYAFTSGNLSYVTKAIAEAHPASPRVLAADNDHHLPRKEKPLPNAGLAKAEEAAKKYGAVVIHPHFGVIEEAELDDGVTPPSDYNDAVALFGPDAVKEMIAMDLKPYGIVLPGERRDERPSIIPEEERLAALASHHRAAPMNQGQRADHAQQEIERRMEQIRRHNQGPDR